MRFPPTCPVRNAAVFMNCRGTAGVALTTTGNRFDIHHNHAIWVKSLVGRMTTEQRADEFVQSLRGRNRREAWGSLGVFVASGTIAMGAVPLLNPIGGMVGLAAAGVIFGVNQFVLQPHEPQTGWTLASLADEVEKQGKWMLWSPLWYFGPILIAMLAALPPTTSVLSLIIIAFCGFLAVKNVRIGQGLRHSAAALRAEAASDTA